MISQSFKGNRKNTFEYMHPSTPLPKQQQAVHCVCACRSSAGVGAGSRDRVHTPCAMDHEILSFLIHISRFGFIPCAAWEVLRHNLLILVGLPSLIRV